MSFFSLCILYRHNAAICYCVKTWFFGIILCIKKDGDFFADNSVKKLLLLLTCVVSRPEEVVGVWS